LVTAIHEFYERLKYLQWFKAVFSNPRVKKIIIKENQDRLELTGESIEGDVIGRYSALTEVLSGGEKKRGSHYTLKDTGYFYNSMRVSTFEDYIVIDADGKKDNVDWSAPSVGAVGLSDEQIEELGEQLIPIIIKTFRDGLQIN